MRLPSLPLPPFSLVNMEDASTLLVLVEKKNVLQLQEEETG